MKISEIDPDEVVVLCVHCGKVLTDPTSTNLQIGPICRKRIALVFDIKPEEVTMEHVTGMED